MERCQGYNGGASGWISNMSGSYWLAEGNGSLAESEQLSEVSCIQLVLRTEPAERISLPVRAVSRPCDDRGECSSFIVRRLSSGSCPWEWCKSDVVVLSPASLAG
jgi:hypothetical protein